jgi:hypothetical protein
MCGRAKTSRCKFDARRVHPEAEGLPSLELVRPADFDTARTVLLPPQARVCSPPPAHVRPRMLRLRSTQWDPESY